MEVRKCPYALAVRLVFCMIPGWWLPAAEVQAQDPAFSQLYANPMMQNPAFAGSKEHPRAGLFYRQQGQGLERQYLSYGLAYDRPFEPVHGGFGLQVWNDDQGQGIIRRTSLDALYAYQMQFSKDWFFDAGFQVSWVQKKVETSGLILPDMIGSDGSVQLSQENLNGYSRNYADFSVGFMSYFHDFFGGIALFHLTEPTESFSESEPVLLDRKLSLQAGISIYAGGRREDPYAWVYTPHLLLIKQAEAWNITWGLNLSLEKYVAGIRLRQDGVRALDALILLAGVSVAKYDISYSFDLELPRDGISRSVSGAHELTFLWNFRIPEKRKKIRAIKCPWI